MTRVGVRELKQQATEILRRVREEQEEYIITYRGRAIARLIPVREENLERLKALTGEVWAEMDRLAEEISAQWPPGVSAIETVKEGRRGL